MKTKRFILQARVVRCYSKGKPSIWRNVESFDTREEAEAAIPPNKHNTFQIIDRGAKKCVDFGSSFLAVCREKGITPRQAAKLCGYPPKMGKYFAEEVQTPRYNTLKRLSNGLGVEVYRLLGTECEHIKEMGRKGNDSETNIESN